MTQVEVKNALQNAALILHMYYERFLTQIALSRETNVMIMAKNATSS